MPPGPVPKRKDQLRRRNASEPVDTVTLSGRVEVPDLDLVAVHPLARDLYDSLKESGQSMFYEPSDWQRARLMVSMLSDLLTTDGKRSSMMYAAIQQDLRDLMVCEADRRRLKMEIDRTPADTSEQDARVSQMAAYRRVAGR